MTTSVARATKVGAPARRGLRYIPIVAFGTDLMLITLSVLAAVLGRETIQFPMKVPDGRVGSALDVAGPLMILGWVAAIFLLGGYRPQVFGAGIDEYKNTVSASLLTAAAVGIGCYLLRFQLSRGFFVLAFLIGIPALVLGRHLLRRSIHRARIGGALQHRVVIAGTEGHVDEIAAVLGREKWLGYQVAGALTPEPAERSTTYSGVPLLGSSDSVAQVAHDVEADVIFLAGGAFDSGDHVRRLVWELEDEDIQVVIAPSVTDVSRDRVSVRPVGGLPLIHMENPRSEAAARRAKRSFDIAAGVALMLLTAPVLLVAAFEVWRHDRGPVLVRQTHIGRDGRRFRVWNLRTMVLEDEQLMAPAEQHGTDGEDVLFEAVDDTRLTAPGRWMRRHAIHELPELLNVVVGDMSLVGPRVPLSHEITQLEELNQRLRVRPGLTGVWRDFRRSDLSWSEAVTLDLHYAENWSMLQDLSIVTRTIGAGVRGTAEVTR